MAHRAGSDGDGTPRWASELTGRPAEPAVSPGAGPRRDWISGRSREELKADLRRHLEALGARPRDLPLRLRVAALQLRLGRVDEALVHYEGVLKGYVRAGDLPSAIALCRRILAGYPHLGRLREIEAKLEEMARAAAAPAPGGPVRLVRRKALPGDEPAEAPPLRPPPKRSP